MLQLYKASSKVSRRSTFWNREYFPSFLIETLLALIHPNIFCKDKYFTTNKSYYLEEITDNINDYVLINNSKSYFPNLSFAVQSGKLWDFRAECLPIYLRKSEAEINLDKKSLS